MTIGIDGMASGLDTKAIIDGLIAIQANQRVLLKRKSSDASELVKALQGLNTRAASLADAAKKVADPASWAVTTASASHESVAVSAATTARPGTVEFAVDRLATGQATLLEATALTGTFTIASGGQNHEVAPLSGHIDDITTAINDLRAQTGVSATKVRTGTDEDGAATYSLQLTGATGAANSFTVHAGTDTSGPELGTTLASAQDAAITLWPGSGAGRELTSATNTFQGLLDGVDVTVSQITTDPVTLTVGTDSAAQQKLAGELITNLSTVLSEIASRSRTSTSTDSSGNTVVTGGLFSGDSAIRFLTSDLQAAVTNPVEGQSPSSIGINIDRYGAISLNESALADAMAADPEKAMATLQAIAGRVAEVAERASDPSKGTLSTKISSQESVVKDLGEQISRWDTRLEARRAQLLAQFTAMEVRLSQLQSTQSWLSGQLAGLNASRE